MKSSYQRLEGKEKMKFIKKSLDDLTATEQYEKSMLSQLDLTYLLSNVLDENAYKDLMTLIEINKSNIQTAIFFALQNELEEIEILKNSIKITAEIFIKYIDNILEENKKEKKE